MEQKIIEKISKLLKLSESNSEAEATSAMEKAHQLLKEHNLKISDIKEKSEINSLVFDFGSKATKWKKLLLNGIAKANYCSLMEIAEYKNNKRVVCCKIFGRECNVETSKVLYDYLVEAIERIAKEERNNCKTMNLNSFKVGVVSNILLRLRKQSQTEEVGLMILNQESRKEMYNQYPDIKSVSLKVNTDAYSSNLGLKAGDKISLNSQVSNVRKNTMCLR